jgi:hypothetical protein
LIAWLFGSHRVSDISAMSMTRASLRNNRACRKNDGNAMGIGFRLQEENKSNESCGRILSSTYSASIIRYTSLLDTSCARVCGRSSLFVWHGPIVWSSCTILICPVQTCTPQWRRNTVLFPHPGFSRNGRLKVRYSF